MPRRYRLSPTAFIERGNPKVERAYYKGPRKPLARASKRSEENIDFVLFRTPKSDETTHLHTHSHNLKQRMTISPGGDDLDLMRTPSMNGIRTWGFANRRGKKVAGYMIVRGKSSLSQIKEPLKLKPFESDREMNERFHSITKELTKAGRHVRMVPNLKAGYIYHNGRFVKARTKTQLQNSKKQRVSFLAKS